MTGRSCHASEQAPGRTAVAVKGKIGRERPEREEGLVDAEPAACTPCACRIGAPLVAFDPYRIERFLDFDRDVLVVRMRQRLERSHAIAVRRSAPATVRGIEVVEITLRFRMDAAGAVGAEGGVVPARNAVRQYRRHRRDDGVDHRREHGRILAHRRIGRGAEELALRKDHFHRCESALIGGFVRGEQVLERDARAGFTAAVVARVVGAAQLLAYAGVIDGELAIGNVHLDVDRDALADVHAIVVKEAAHLVGAFGDRTNRGARGLLRARPDGVDRAKQHRRAMAFEQFLEQLPALDAAGQLRGNVTEQHFRQPRIVLDDAVDVFHRLAAPQQFHSAQLQAFLEHFGGVGPRARARVGAADVDPVGDDCHECDHTLRLVENRRVHDDVVQVLAERAGMVGEDDIARLDPVHAVQRDAVGHRAADHAGGKQRQALPRQRNDPPLPVHHADGVILVFVDQRTECGAHQVGLDKVGDGLKVLADDFHGDRVDPDRAVRIDTGHHAASSVKRRPTCMRISPSRPISKRSAGPTMVVEPYSSITAGPAAAKPGGSVSRE